MKKIAVAVLALMLAVAFVPCQAQNSTKKYEGSKSFKKCMPAFDKLERQFENAASSDELMSALSDFYSEKNPLYGNIEAYSDMTFGEMSQLSERFNEVFSVFLKRYQELGGLGEDSYEDMISPYMKEYHQIFGSDSDSGFGFSFDIDLGPDNHYHYDSNSDPNFDPNSDSNFHFEFGPGIESSPEQEAEPAPKAKPSSKEKEYQF